MIKWFNEIWWMAEKLYKKAHPKIALFFISKSSERQTYFLSKLLLINLVKYLLRFQIGSFFMINLCLVVIATQFSETKRRETAKMKAERARYRSSSTLSSFTTSETTNCYRQVCLGFKFYFVHWISTMGPKEHLWTTVCGPS